MSVLGLVPSPSSPGLRHAFLAGLGLVLFHWLCWVITGLCLTLATISGPDLDLDMPPHILAPYGEVTAPAWQVAVLHS